MLWTGGELVAAAIDVLWGASLVDVVVLGTGEETTVAVLSVLGRVEVSVTVPVRTVVDSTPAIAALLVVPESAFPCRVSVRLQTD